MKTTRVIIDVGGNMLKIRDKEDKLNLNMFEVTHNPEPKDTQVVDDVLSVTSTPWHISRLLKKCSSYFSPQQLKEEEKELL